MKGKLYQVNFTREVRQYAYIEVVATSEAAAKEAAIAERDDSGLEWQDDDDGPEGDVDSVEVSEDQEEE